MFCAIRFPCRFQSFLFSVWAPHHAEGSQVDCHPGIQFSRGKQYNPQSPRIALRKQSWYKETRRIFSAKWSLNRFNIVQPDIFLERVSNWCKSVERLQSFRQALMPREQMAFVGRKLLEIKLPIFHMVGEIRSGLTKGKRKAPGAKTA